MAAFVVGLTGGVASGKSELGRRFQALGVRLVDADLAAREVVAPGQPALVEIAARKQAELDAFIQVGIDSIERGDFYTQEEMEDWVESLIDSRKKAA